MPKSLMDYNADRFSKTGKMPAVGRGKKATKLRANILKKAAGAAAGGAAGAAVKKAVSKYRSTGAPSVVGKGKRADKIRKHLQKNKARREFLKREKEAEKAKKKMGSPLPKRKHRMDRGKKKRRKMDPSLILADETEAGSMDDDASERIKRRKKMLEEAAG